MHVAQLVCIGEDVAFSGCGNLCKGETQHYSELSVFRLIMLLSDYSYFPSQYWSDGFVSSPAELCSYFTGCAKFCLPYRQHGGNRRRGQCQPWTTSTAIMQEPLINIDGAGQTHPLPAIIIMTCVPRGGCASRHMKNFKRGCGDGISSLKIMT